ncbi:hypothetical protein GO491_11820 [Flavobacteriaceae bacterium Ap0902]|nr:hypothetical protein [Flavobacteriaceae bacterium Ap0902]
MTFLELNSDYNYSPDVVEKDTIALYLKPYEVYRQVFKLNRATLILGGVDQIDTTVKLIKNGTEANGLFYNSELIKNSKNELFIIVDFVLAKDFHSDCLKLRINSRETNPFICSNDDIEFTSLVTYWHSENIDGLPFVETEYKPLQIRLPLYFKTTRTEEDSEEYVTSFRARENVRRSRVKRVFKSVWNVDANNWMNVRIAKMSDLDFVYINKVRQSSTPYVFNETDDAAAFVISEWETQPRENDTVQLPSIGFIYVESHTIEAVFDRDTVNYSIRDFWYNYYHSLGLPEKETSVKILNNDGSISSYTYEEIMEGRYYINLENELDSFTHEINYYIEDKTGLKSNIVKLIVNFKREGFFHYSPEHYKNTKYA